MQNDDEINLLDLLIVLLKYKGMVIVLVLLVGIATTAYSFILPKIYRSECAITPTPSDEEKSSFGNRLADLDALVAYQLSMGGTGSLEQFEAVLKAGN